MTFFPEQDRHLYLYCAIGLLAVSLALLFLDDKLSRAFSVAGGILILAGAYWIAAGVVLKPGDALALDRSHHSGGAKYYGIDPNKKIVTDMFKVQSRRARVGVLFVLAGTALQICGAYIV